MVGDCFYVYNLPVNVFWMEEHLLGEQFKVVLALVADTFKH